MDVEMHALRFLSIFAAAIAAWMVLMWFTLAAVSASESQSEQAQAPTVPVMPAVPAASEPAADDSTTPAVPEAIGAGWLFDTARPMAPAGDEAAA